MMEKLCTIQKRGKLNEVHRKDGPGPGGAYHSYVVSAAGPDEWPHEIVAEIQFQYGPRNHEDSKSGVLDVDLLEIVRDRMKRFQEGPFATRENEMALNHVEEALMWLNKRTEDRLERGVLGTYDK